MITSFTGKNDFLSNFLRGYSFSAPWYWDELNGPVVGYYEGGELPTMEWYTNEHYYQAIKARELTIAMTIASRSTPGAAKRRGNQILLRDGFHANKLNGMLTGLRYKFAHPELRNQLKYTQHHRLIEGNNHGDDYWGAVWVKDVPTVQALVRQGQIAWAGPRTEGILVGHNWLGRLIEIVREEVKHGT